MTIEREAALKITPLFYEAVLDHTRWEKTLEIIRDEFDSSVATFSFLRFSDLNVIFGVSTDRDTTGEECWQGLNVPSNGAIASRSPAKSVNKPCTCHVSILGDQSLGTALYKSVLNPCGYHHVLAMPVLFHDDDFLAVLGLLRKSSDRPYCSRDSEKLGLYLPHFRRAMSNLKAYLESRHRAACQKALVDQLHHGVLLCDQKGKIVESNPAADRILDRANGLVRSDKWQIEIDDPHTASLLSQSLYGITKRKSSNKINALATFHVKRASGATPYFVTVRALESNSCDYFHLNVRSSLAMVCIVDPDAQLQTDSENLKRLFGLTAAEAEVLLKITRGHSPQEIAEMTGRAYQTVRNQLQSVRNKTGARRQADLIRLTLNSTHNEFHVMRLQ